MLDWIDRYGDRDGDGYLEYERRNAESGLENQCWKDSWNSILAAGLARYGYRQEAGRIARALLEAATYFDYRLPEVFAGYPRALTRFPVEYPTASSPQAWATGAPLLFIRMFLGLEPRGDKLATSPAVPDAIGALTLRGIPGRWGRLDAGLPATETY